MNLVGTRNDANRQSWIQERLRSLPAGGRILDAGAGEQRHRAYCAHLNYVSQDFAQYDPSQKATGLQMPAWDYGKLDIVSDITAIPEKDASFDAILCSEVLEHIPDPVGALREFARLLRSGGRLILTAPFCSLTHFAPYHYSTGFSRFFYEKHLSEMAFDICEITPNGNYFEYVAQEIRRVPSVNDRYAGKIWVPWSGLLLRTVLWSLDRLSRADGKSSELLCFGWHVLAQKR